MDCPLGKKNCPVRQSFAEVGDVFQIQETCSDCGSGCGKTVSRAEGLAMIQAKEQHEFTEAKKREEKEKAEAKAAEEAKKTVKKDK